MKPSTMLARTALLILCTAVFAGTAFAGDKPKEDAPGNSANAPGQAKKAEKQAAKTGRKNAKAEQRSSKAAGKSGKSGSFKATSSGTDLKTGLDHKHTICHATGSATNPFVVITPSISGVFNGHMGHQGGEDIVPPFTYKGESYSQNWDAEGQALLANGCRPAAAAAQTTTAATTSAATTTAADCPPASRTVTEVVLGGVFHKTGSATNPYVFIRPSKNSAHYDKHEDDIVVPDQTVTRTIEVAGNCDEAQRTGQTTTVTLSNETVTVPGTTTTVAGSTVTVPGQTVTVGGEAVVQTEAVETTEEAGGVLGAQSPPPSGEAGGVLDSVASIGETAVTGTLPFTGIPLWIAALVGGGLLAAGSALRRTA